MQNKFQSFYFKSVWLVCFFLGSSPPCRWIVNFDFDFMDGLVLAALVSAHVPFVVRFVLLFLLLSTGYSNTNCLQKLFSFKCVTNETKKSFVSRTSALLVSHNITRWRQPKCRYNVAMWQPALVNSWFSQCCQIFNSFVHIAFPLQWGRW